MSDADENPTVGETYNTLDVTQKKILEDLVQEVRRNPLNKWQIELFAFFLQEASYGSMTKQIPIRGIPRET